MATVTNKSKVLNSKKKLGDMTNTKMKNRKLMCVENLVS